MFTLENGVAQGCSLSFSVFIIKEVEQAELEKSLQKLIDVVHGYCNKWRLKPNVSKSAVKVFSKNSVEDGCKWTELPKVSSYMYTYLGVDFACNGAWDAHLKRVLDNGRKR